jgi:hypothetical protein
MRTKSILAGLAATIIGILLAQSDADYQGWMKTVAATNQSLQKNLAAKNAEGISADATKLPETFKQVEVFWQRATPPMPRASLPTRVDLAYNTLE